MLVIRLARTGRAKYPTYRIVAAESARAATGRFVAILGHYNPHTKELVLKTDEIKMHLSHGAQPSNTVVKLLLREKMELPSWVKLKTKAKKSDETSGDSASASADTEVTPEEASSDAKASESTAPALEQADERVATTVQADASDAEAKAPSIDRTDTAASEEAQAEEAVKGSDAAAKVAADKE